MSTNPIPPWLQGDLLGSPACMEPTIILAQLAKEDSIFDHGISIASMMETADPEYFKNVDEFLPIPIKAKAKDRFVLHAIESASSSGRGTTSVAMAQHQSATSTSTLLAADNNSPTSSSNWLCQNRHPGRHICVEMPQERLLLPLACLNTQCTHFDA
ncbi:uncharacterized protein UBRO_20189 [Ustilago bromivora]|uniref:Uncharacterized protein n=1 Tax=Ustilago bromivora TaxID=307758 RepID=A0A1K0G7B2_9BASI|nr:uncharacterized protein UBRO_20189 [Ustilago bromivora]